MTEAVTEKRLARLSRTIRPGEVILHAWPGSFTTDPVIITDVAVHTGSGFALHPLIHFLEIPKSGNVRLHFSGRVLEFRLNAGTGEEVVRTLAAEIPAHGGAVNVPPPASGGGVVGGIAFGI